jgi:hypothetical protein
MKDRKYPRRKAPKGLHVAWKSGGSSTVSRAATIGLGGLFLHTLDPPPSGTVMELLFDLPSGEVRAKASVRDSVPGKGMGVQFIQMQTTDRSRLDKFLAQCDKETSEPNRDETTKNQQASPAAARKPLKKGLLEKKPLEKRKVRSALRCSLVASAEVTDLKSKTRLSARISELAIGGCYVDALNPFPEGTIAKIKITRNRGVFETNAKVVYSQQDAGIGLVFTEIAPEQRSILEDWLAEVITQHKPV